jgi:hypothetical protein
MFLCGANFLSDTRRIAKKQFLYKLCENLCTYFPMWFKILMANRFDGWLPCRNKQAMLRMGFQGSPL